MTPRSTGTSLEEEVQPSITRQSAPDQRLKVLRIKTFGGLSLERDGVRIEGTSPRRAALLAILAAAGPRGVTRDRLLLLLWPDSTEERARHNLAQLVYATQKALGAEVLESVGADVRLSASVGSDVAEFQDAEGRRDWERMVTLYEGPFLDGFVLPDAVEFDQWAEGQRARLNTAALAAMEHRARAAKGDEAVGWWRRLVGIEPLATRYAVGLAEALVQAGNPGAAARHLREHQRLLRSEVGAAPPPELQRLLDAIGRSSPAVDARGVEVAAPAPASPVAGTDPSPPVQAPAPARARSRRWVTPVAAVAVAVTAVGAWWVKQAPARQLVGGEMVVLADVENLTRDSTIGPALRVAAGVSLQQSPGFSLYPRSRLAASLARMGRRASDTVLTEDLARELARREGGRVVVVFQAAPLGQELLLAVRLVDPQDGRVLASRSRQVAATEVIEGVDRLGAWVRRQLGDAGRPPRPLPLVTTASVAALEAFADADAALLGGRWEDVRTSLERALATDTGFAMAMRGLGEYYRAINRVPQALHWLRAAAERKDRLTEQEQIAIRASLAQIEGRTADLVAATGELATRFPSPTNWAWLGEALRQNRQYSEAVAAYEKAVDLAPASANARLGLAIARKSQGDLRGALDAYAAVFRIDSMILLRDFQNLQWGETHVLVGDLAQAEAVFRKMTAVPSAADRARGYRALAYLAIYRGRFAEAAEHLATAIPLHPKGGLSEYRDWALLADVELTRGRTAAARAALDRAWEIFRSRDLQAAAVMFGGHQMVRAGLESRAQTMLDTLRQRAALRPNFQQDQESLAILTADLALSLGDLRGAEAALAGRRFADYRQLGWSLAAEVLTAQERHDSALARWREVVEARRFGDEMQLDWLRGFQGLAAAAERAGDPATARATWSALLEQWKDGDPDLPPLVAARRELLRLQGAGGR